MRSRIGAYALAASTPMGGRRLNPTSFQDPAPKLWSSICSGGDNCAKSEVVAPGIDTLNGVAETSYASCGDLSLAYQVFGDGPVELVFAGSFVSHVELFWTLPEFQAFMEQLSTFCRVLVFDKAGVGLSDPVPQVRTLDDRAAEIEAVMDAVGFGRAALFGVSEGGPAAMVFAATRPERTRALILTGSYSFFGFTGWDDIERDPAELRARILPELGADYTPSTEQIVRLQELGRAIRSAWGGGAALRDLLPSVRSTRQLAMLERMSASPGMARATIESAFRIDVRPILSTISDANPRHPCQRRPRSGAGRPVPRRPHPRRAVARGRRNGQRALVHRSRRNHERDRGVPHRQPRGAGAVPSRPAHRVVHRHGRLDGTCRGHGR